MVQITRIIYLSVGLHISDSRYLRCLGLYMYVCSFILRTCIVHLQETTQKRVPKATHPSGL